MSLAKFDALMSHLNSEENEMAAEFRAELNGLVRDSDHLNTLRNRGVDNWDGYVGPGCGACPACGDEYDAEDFGPNGLCFECEVEA